MHVNTQIDENSHRLKELNREEKSSATHLDFIYFSLSVAFWKAMRNRFAAKEKNKVKDRN